MKNTMKYTELKSLLGASKLTWWNPNKGTRCTATLNGELCGVFAKEGLSIREMLDREDELIVVIRTEGLDGKKLPEPQYFVTFPSGVEI